jgi:hypothetical protein
MWRLSFMLVAIIVSTVASVAGQDMPADYKQLLETLGRQGDFKDSVLRVNIPRTDLKVTVEGIATPTPFGFGGWVAFTKGTGGMDVMMGDLVLTEQEVNPVMSALLSEGFEVTAIHNHFFYETPRIFYMHVHGHGKGPELATKLKPAVALIGKNPPSASPVGSATALEGPLDTAALAKIIGNGG